MAGIDESALTLTTGCGDGSKQRLSVRFSVEEDRHRHEIGLPGSELSLVLLRSIDSGDDWPASPPLQQVVRELHDEQPVLLGIGLSGRSHWSVAIKSTPAAAIEFQNACRVNSNPVWLGSTYQVGESCELTAMDDRKLLIRESTTGGSITVQTDSNTGLQVDALSKQIRICADFNCNSLPSTISWQYSIAIV